jgi:hypothetical protein
LNFISYQFLKLDHPAHSSVFCPIGAMPGAAHGFWVFRAPLLSLLDSCDSPRGRHLTARSSSTSDTPAIPLAQTDGVSLVFHSDPQPKMTRFS